MKIKTKISWCTTPVTTRRWEEGVKEGTGIEVLTTEKVLTRCPVLLAQIKARNNSYNLKN